MRMFLRIFLAVGGLLLLFDGSPVRAQQMYLLDPVPSTVRFTVSAPLHKVHGRALELVGMLRVREEGPVWEAQGEVIARSDSLTAKNTYIDRRMHNLLQSDLYSRITCTIESFSVERFSDQQVSSGRIRALLAIRNISHQFESSVVVSKTATGFIVRGQTVVSLRAYDVPAPNILGVLKVEDAVLVDFSVAFNRSEVTAVQQ